MKKLNAEGFSAIEGLLILVIIGIIGGVGWYVWEQNKVENVPKEINSNAVVETNETTEYTNKELGFSFTYPKKLGQLTLSEESNKRRHLFFEGSTRRDIFTIDLNQRSIELLEGDAGHTNTYGYELINGNYRWKDVFPFSNDATAQEQLTISKADILAETDSYILVQYVNLDDQYSLIGARKLANHTLYDAILISAGNEKDAFTKDSPLVKQTTSILDSFKQL